MQDLQDPNPRPWWEHGLAEWAGPRDAPRLAPRWREVLRRAWSVRLMAASFAAQVLGIGLTVAGSVGVQDTPWRALALQVLGAALGLAAFAARLVYQRGLSDEA